jgi:hypothetical protein
VPLLSSNHPTFSIYFATERRIPAIDKGKENAYNEIINPEYFYKDSRGRASGS